MSNNNDIFGDFLLDTEKAVNDIPQQEKEEIAVDERLERWKQKRIGLITASNLTKLMNLDKKGHVKTKAGIDYLLEVMHQRQTRIDEQETFAKAFEWGHQYEEEALNYYNKVTGNNVLSATYGFDDIVFRTPVEGFGDSPDGITENNKGVVEIKCPYNGANHLRNCAETVYHDGLDYFWQIIGHLVPSYVDWVDFVSYDPRYEDGHPNKIKIIRINRADVQTRIDQLVAKIAWWNELINSGDITKIIEEA